MLGGPSCVSEILCTKAEISLQKICLSCASGSCGIALAALAYAATSLEATPLYVAAMNEVTWQHVMAWEALHAGECAKPQLLRFTGRPDELRCRSSF